LKLILAALLTCGLAYAQGESVCRLQAKYGDITAHGTAIAIHKHTLLTCYHNVNQGTFQIEHDGKWLDAEIIKYSILQDLAVISVKASLKPIKFSELPALVIAGSASGKAIVSKPVSGLYGAVIKADVQMGESGGALLDGKGRLVGMIVGVEDHENSGRGRIVGVDAIREFVK
jgi:S1-C subfamily serine protease